MSNDALAVNIRMYEVIWPSGLASTEEQHEQERRVFYIAFRVRRPLVALVNDSMLGGPSLPSRCIAEISLAVPRAPGQ